MREVLAAYPQDRPAAADRRVLGDGHRRRHRLLAARSRRLPPGRGAAARVGRGRVPHLDPPPRGVRSVDGAAGARPGRRIRPAARVSRWNSCGAGCGPGTAGSSTTTPSAVAVGRVATDLVDGLLAVPFDSSIAAERAIGTFTGSWIAHLRGVGGDDRGPAGPGRARGARPAGLARGRGAEVRASAVRAGPSGPGDVPARAGRGAHARWWPTWSRG